MKEYIDLVQSISILVLTIIFSVSLSNVANNSKTSKVSWIRRLFKSRKPREERPSSDDREMRRLIDWLESND